MTMLVVALALWAGIAAGSVKYKCDGEWVGYWPCDSKPAENGSATDAIHEVREESPLVFNGSPSVRLVDIAVEFEVAQIAARACERELKAEDDGIKCKALLTKLGKNSRFQQATNEYLRLLADVEFTIENKVEVARLIGIQKEILKIMKLFNNINRS